MVNIRDKNQREVGMVIVKVQENIQGENHLEICLRIKALGIGLIEIGIETEATIKHRVGHMVVFIDVRLSKKSLHPSTSNNSLS